MLVDLTRRLVFTLMAFAVSLALPVVSPVSANPGTMMFKLLTDEMPRARKVMFCAYLAENAARQAAESPDPAVRVRRAATAAQLTARLAPDLAKARARLSPPEISAIEQENGQAMGLLSYAPSDEVRAQLKAGADQEDILGLFIDDVLKRCDAMLDTLGIAKAPLTTAPPPVPAFRWRGLSAEEAFAGTGLAPFAVQLCAVPLAAAPDFTGAPLTERGQDGISLLDWAMECGDKASFAALIAAGFDTAAPGASGNAALVRAAEKRDLFYLETLLAAAAKPDVMGSAKTALATAWQSGTPGGGAAFERLRAAGASLNFPGPDWSMWRTWSTYARWEEILANWSAFASDPVNLARSVSMELERSDTRGNVAALKEIKARLIAQHGVCFPVGPLIALPRDQRGFFTQPDCPPRKDD